VNLIVCVKKCRFWEKSNNCRKYHIYALESSGYWSTKQINKSMWRFSQILHNYLRCPSNQLPYCTNTQAKVTSLENVLNAPPSFVKWKSDTVKMYLSPKTYPWWRKSQNVLKLESERTSSSLDEVVILLTWSLVRCNPLFLLREVTLYGDFSNAEVQEV